MLVIKVNLNGGINMEEVEDDCLDEEFMMMLIVDVFGVGIDIVFILLIWVLFFIFFNFELQYDLQVELK